ncbi:MAG: hypothetical protein LR015_02735 [Verrucomicrobia bacterium]|nr:hypothetical protein [Verrucomicrobiota bacterium]
MPGGSIVLRADNIDPATLNNLDVSPARVNPAPIVGRGQLNIAEGAMLSTSGMLVDERTTGIQATAPAFSLTGGSIALTGFHTTVAEGSVLDVSGGARINARNQLTFGNAGSLSLSGGRDAALDSVIGGSLLLAGELRGFSGDQGALLTLTAPSVVIAEAASGLSAHQLLLTPDFFQHGWFQSLQYCRYWSGRCQR